MKMHPLLVIGVVIASAGAGYYFRSALPMMSVTDPSPGKKSVAGDETAAGSESAEVRRTLAAIEAENDIRRAIEQREQEALAQMAAGSEPAPTEPEPMLVEKVSAEPFYDELAPHGEWLGTDEYGDVWQPREASDPDWQPYTNGGWSYTDAGLTWEPLEPWGDIPYHYGRWVDLVDPGWCWVPGYDWAPAWVSWRCNDDYIGWAPLPPCVPWRTAAGIGPWVDACGGLGPRSYCFVPTRHFGAANCRPVLCARSENAAHFGRTRNLTRLVSKPGSGHRTFPVLEGPAAQRLAALGVKDLRHRRLEFVDGGTRASKSDSGTVSVRRVAVPARRNAPGETSVVGSKASRHLGHSRSTNVWQGAGDAKTVAAARRKVFAEAQQNFRGLPRLVPPVDAGTTPAQARRSASAKVAPARVLEPVGAQREPVRPGRVTEITMRQSDLTSRVEPAPSNAVVAPPAGRQMQSALASPRATREPSADHRPLAGLPLRAAGLAPATLEPARGLAPSKPAASSLTPALRQAARDRTSTRGAERLAARAAREKEELEALQRRRTAEAKAIQQQQQQVMHWQPRPQPNPQQEQQRQAVAAQKANEEQQRHAAEQRAQYSRDQTLAEQQQRQQAAEHQASAENQRRQIEVRQQHEFAQRQQVENSQRQQRQEMEHAQQQAMAQERRQAELNQRAQMEHARHQADQQARHIAAQEQQREHQARQVEAQQRQAAQAQQRQQSQMQEAHAQAQAARQHQIESHQRQQPPAHQDGGRAHDKRGR